MTLVMEATKPMLSVGWKRETSSGLQHFVFPSIHTNSHFSAVMLGMAVLHWACPKLARFWDDRVVVDGVKCLNVKM